MKYKKRETNPRRGLELPALESMTIDQIGTISDDELYERLRVLEAGREKLLQNHCVTRSWEEEICYVRREIQIRRGRREAHAAFMAAVEQEIANNQLAEKHLPAADLDNTKFIAA